MRYACIIFNLLPSKCRDIAYFCDNYNSIDFPNELFIINFCEVFLTRAQYSRNDIKRAAISR